jgi:F-type H+-transporting ATPase subunit a
MDEDFRTRLKIEKTKISKETSDGKSNKSNFFGNAFKLSTELVSAVLVGTILGFILDKWFDTKPNSSLFMLVSLVLISIFLTLSTNKKSIVPGKLQLMSELFYNFIAKMISDTAGSKAKPYFAFIFSLFIFVLFCNMVGMIPYSFTVTSHIIITMLLALVIFIGVTIIGFIKHGFGYLKLFVPSGVPVVLLPLIVVIEIISYLSRPVSLSVRLFANMMAGHTMMKVFGGFVVSLGILGGWLPLSFSVALTGLEILVAFLQAYVFAILTCIYLNDALNLHH